MTALLSDAACGSLQEDEPRPDRTNGLADGTRPLALNEEQSALSASARHSHQASKLSLVRITRAAAVGITVLVAVFSFALSFSSLADLAARTVWPDKFAWLWPVIIDGTIVLATMALVTFSAYPEQRGPRRYFWALLTVGAAVSVAGNAVHAMLPDGRLPEQPLGSLGAAAVACVPPLALVLVTHGLSILWRFTPYEQPDETAQRREDALALAADRLERWEAVAAAIHERGQITSYPTAKIAAALRLLHDTQPPLALRQIGQRLDLRHDTVARIRDAAKSVLAESTLRPGAARSPISGDVSERSSVDQER
ncbi:DUF2637 domain-containing protein (plasmid) [Mycobacterium sp. smrl_JER01]|jgi:hypothetical protein|uniref:DUF2637 domain-containing protein n=1 Tax=Mycobacteriaceae TaxID=1762 RepID=UPI000B942B7C|nr:DUF2637 domain-containing protein [Mycobacterium neumannii]VEG41238.1 Protein of uncharacterised function (DUF2637) [Mycolicibacterium flavescens]